MLLLWPDLTLIFTDCGSSFTFGKSEGKNKSYDVGTTYDDIVTYDMVQVAETFGFRAYIL